MINKNFSKISWYLWATFVLFAVLILVINFIFQIAVNVDQKLTLAMNSLFIILNVISLAFLLLFMVFNLNNHKIEYEKPDSLMLWILLCLYILFALSSTIVLLNSDFYYWKAILTMFAFISALFLFPYLVINLIKQVKNQIIDYCLLIFVVLYLIINLLLTFIIFLKLENIIAFLVTVTTLNLVVSTIFFALLTKKSCNLNKLKSIK